MENGKDKEITINISTTTIIKILLILGLVAVGYFLRDIILILLVSIVLATALNPWVNALQRRKVPRILATVFIFLAFFGSFVLILALLIPPIANQIADITSNFPKYYDQVVNDFQGFRDATLQQNLLNTLQSTLQSLQTNMAQATGGIFSAISSIFGGVFAVLGMIVITFYMLLEEHALKQFVKQVTPLKYQPYVFQLMNRSQERLRLWLKGQLILCLIVGVLPWLGLTIFRVDYALVLGLWAGLTEFVPILGPFLGAIPAVFIAITTGSFIQGLLVAALFIGIQQLENNVIVPKVMEKTVGMNPLIVIIVMLIGAKLAGVAGIILAVPLTLIVKVFSEDFFALKESDENNLAA